MGREKGPRPETDIEITPEALLGFVRSSCNESDLKGLNEIATKYSCNTLTAKQRNIITKMLEGLAKKEENNPLITMEELKALIISVVYKFKLFPTPNN